MEGRLKMIRPLLVRSVTLLCALLLSLLGGACSSGGGNAPSTNAANTNNATKASNVSNAPANTSSGANNQTSGQTAQAKLNINTASANELLQTIPGMGNRMVHEFEEYRPYKSLQQFRREIGKYVDAKQVAEYEKYIYVPISVNESDAATLQQIPGLDANEAEALIAARPFASNEAFLTKLGGSVSAAELAVAKTYLSNQ
jgi:DNA uptake protein ComE-like DNA-binding protein